MEKLMYTLNNREYHIDYELFLTTEDASDLFITDVETDESINVNSLPEFNQQEILFTVLNTIEDREDTIAFEVEEDWGRYGEGSGDY